MAAVITRFIPRSASVDSINNYILRRAAQLPVAAMKVSLAWLGVRVCAVNS